MSPLITRAAFGTAASPPTSSQPLITLDNAFWLSVGVIFMITIISAFIRRRQRDRCVKLFNDFHVTVLSAKADPIWGDLCVTSEGVEVIFDAEYLTRRGLSKTSALVYAEELNDAIALCRPFLGLNGQEMRDRERQLRRSINPNLLRRSMRWIRNAINTVSDAISRTFAMVVGRVTRTGSVGTAVRDQQGDVAALGKTVVGMAGNSYEPLLERHIGAPVVTRMLHPSGADPIELPGHLVEYSSRYIALYSTETGPIEEHTVDLAHPSPHAAFSVDRDDQHMTISCTGAEPIVLAKLVGESHATDLAVALLPGTRVRLAIPENASKLELSITRRVDLIIPRSRGGVRFGSARPDRPRLKWRGISPASEQSSSV
ncbi:MAG: hypothetical protein ABL309_08435 [Phycisphaerales bacterium]